MSLKNGTLDKTHMPEATTEPRELTLATTDNFPSSAAFDAINAAINASDADRKDAIKQGNGVYAFVLKNASGEEASWHIDLKKTGAVGTGVGTKPDGTLRKTDAITLIPDPPAHSSLRDYLADTAALVTLSLSEENFGKLVAGEANAQRLFMGGKLKVKGNVMKATKLDPVLKKAQTKAKL